MNDSSIPDSGQGSSETSPPQITSKTTIVRAKHNKSTRWFLTLRSAAQDSNLSFETRGVLWYLLSKPNDWKIQVGDLQREGHIGRDKVKRMLIELADHNYLERPKQFKTDDGKWDWTPYVLHEEPFTENPSMDDDPLPEKPLTENQLLENQSMDFQSILQSTESQSTEIQNTEKEKTEKPLSPSATEAPIEQTVKKPSKTDLDTMFDAIALAWGTDASGWIVSIRSMLLGTSTRGAWKTCNFDPPMTADELTAFATYWKGKGLSMPSEPEKIQRHVYEWRKERDKPKVVRLEHRPIEENMAELVEFEDMDPEVQAAINALVESLSA